MMKLRSELTAKFGNEVSQKALKSITIAARGLLEFEDKGIAVSTMYDVECDYRYLYAKNNYLFYRVENNRIIIVEMFDEREDFMQKLFGIESISKDEEDYWGEWLLKFLRKRIYFQLSRSMKVLI